MKSTYAKKLLAFINQNPTAFHVVKSVTDSLEQDGYCEYKEADVWRLFPGNKGYVVRNDSSIIAFQIPVKKPEGFHIFSAHSDSPSFRIKVNPEMQGEGACVRLNTEKYGGMILSTWLDRPLSVAGRVITKSKDGFSTKLVNIDRDLCVIPNVAIHMNSDLNKGYEYKPQSDMLPLFSLDSKATLIDLVAKEIKLKKEEILGSDLFLYTRQKGTFFGAGDELIASPRLDDQACVFAGLTGFVMGDSGAEDYIPSDYVNVFAVFDNEEVGSGTKQGADSTFLEDVLFRISEALNYSRTDYLRMLSKSYAISADNAHAVHPAFPSKADPTNKPTLNKGVVLKFNGNQRYSTDAFSEAVFKDICMREKIPYQTYVNHSDIPGGSTLGNISTAHVSVPTADIGIAELSMHSAVETMGSKDIDYMVSFAAGLFKA